MRNYIFRSLFPLPKIRRSNIVPGLCSSSGTACVKVISQFVLEISRKTLHYQKYRPKFVFCAKDVSLLTWAVSLRFPGNLKNIFLSLAILEINPYSTSGKPWPVPLPFNYLKTHLPLFLPLILVGTGSRLRTWRRTFLILNLFKQSLFVAKFVRESPCPGFLLITFE